MRALTLSFLVPLGCLALSCAGVATRSERGNCFDVRDYGASGRSSDDARPAIQRAIDACAATGGGTVRVPPGEYTSGSLELRSHVRVLLERGATIRSAKGKAAFPKEALFYGEDLERIALEGGGTIDGRAEYEWRENDIEDDYIRPNLLLMQAAGKSLRRPFPKPDSIVNLVRLVRCTDVRIRELSFKRSPSWNIHLWGCERIVLDGLDIRSSLSEGVWSDGIDPDGCRDLRISNCVIETGDDALVFYSTNLFGPARPCEDITVTNCRLTSSSSALKFCDGNQNCVRRVTISNCVIANSNRGIAFMVFDGGYVSDVVISNVSIECTRRDWFWWGDGDPLHFNIKRRSDVHARLDPAKQPPAGSIRNVRIQNVIARGMGTSSIEGHPDSPLEHITIDGLELHIASDPAAVYDKSEHALAIRKARDFSLRNVEVHWDEPASARWKSTIAVEDTQRLRLEGCVVRPGMEAAPAILLRQVAGAVVRGCAAAAGTRNFLHVSGAASSDIQLLGNDLRQASVPWSADSDDLLQGEIHSAGDLVRSP